MEKEVLRRYFDEAVQNGNQSKAVIFGTDLADMGEQIHVMLGYKQLQEANPTENIQAAILYVKMALDLSKVCRKSTSLQSST